MRVVVVAPLAEAMTGLIEMNLTTALTAGPMRVAVVAPRNAVITILIHSGRVNRLSEISG
jgi:hypothetical protein